jgi:hypothetical protein
VAHRHCLQKRNPKTHRQIERVNEPLTATLSKFFVEKISSGREYGSKKDEGETAIVKVI